MYQFGKYKLRPAKEEDRENVSAWIEADDDHRGRVVPDFFIAGEPGCEKFVLEDERGKIFYFRMDRVVRIHVQFAPTESEDEKQRLREAIADGFEWLKGMASGAGIREILFESTTRSLVNFCKRRIRFKDVPNELRLVVGPPTPRKAVENPVLAEHHKV